ncbi:hypothetical protein Caci_7328 [Catenulispora acidiphila DSM 44928]|uniref:Uncharacterized protein n=1 Tax=Catenulispora acidiphila (strain DSM 44928 / JCM 14897 / NBRC 102108 / NRRL B-24433 / ID139908) TaxID=479433 RepID=C7Q8G9_CATAD|nr:hypothetical protein [Catenulispora acidiphila]ACU76157.1 hypothetical protein Caci_7328 [Catenulispora acidiphila DSM 44928]
MTARKNHSSKQARKRQERELRDLADRLTVLEQELHADWLRQLDEEIQEALGEDTSK